MKKAILALGMGAFFIVQIFAPCRSLRKMQVIYVDQRSGYTSLIDSEGDVYGIFADEIEVGDEVIAYCRKSGVELEVLDYTLVER